MAKFKTYSIEQGELVPIYLGDWIPEDHLVRVVSDIVDQLDLTVITAKYSVRGEEAFHPALLLKVLFYGYATGVFSSRKLRKALFEILPFRWLCGSGDKPDHRTISDFRKDNLTVLPGMFRQIVQIASELGYVSLGHVSIDGSKMKADASKHKAMSRERMKQEIEKMEQEIAATLQQAQEEDRDEEEHPDQCPPSVNRQLNDRQQRLEKIKDALRQLEERQPAKDSRHPEKDQINFTDPDSRIMETKTQGVIQGYNPQIAVEEDHHLIVGLAMSSSASDQKQFEGVLASVEAYTGSMPETVTADAGYFSAENIGTAESAAVDAYIAAKREGKQAKNPYDKTNFTYHPENDTYTCPASQSLALKQTQHEKDPDQVTKWVYESQACSGCPFQSECVKAKSGQRTITRSEADPVREAMRTKVQSDEGKAIYRKRKGIVEPAWGEMKEVQGFRQFSLRGKAKVEGEFILLALSYNLRKIHAAKYPKQATLYKRERAAQKEKLTA